MRREWEECMQKMIRNLFQLLSFRHFSKIQCHFNSKFVYEANSQCFFLFIWNGFFMKIVWRRKEIPWGREWSADVMYISQDLKIDFVQRLFSLWTWTHIYFGIALALFTRLLFTLDGEDVAMVFFCCTHAAFNQIERFTFFKVAIKIELRAHVMKRWKEKLKRMSTLEEDLN